MHNKKVHIFGNPKSVSKHFEKGLNTSGKILDVGGDALLYAGASNPELLPLGVASHELGQGAKKISKILKKSRKKKNKKK
mmetsp:Transcript_32810/g.38492  ORF Transcript_32810/g.38492 Transcript_32810/m.38492 type:complete len:80 (-) Transcript_32810:2968-3207(-)